MSNVLECKMIISFSILILPLISDNLVSNLYKYQIHQIVVKSMILLNSLRKIIKYVILNLQSIDENRGCQDNVRKG